MNSDALRELQAPLKERCENDPQVAAIAPRADGRVRFELDSNAAEERLATLLRSTERYYAVYRTLAHSPHMFVEMA